MPIEYHSVDKADVDCAGSCGPDSEKPKFDAQRLEGAK
jgi:hypothetical protein